MTNDVTAADAWGAHASSYDQMFAPLTGYIARAMLTLAERHLGPNTQLLDVACGSGALLIPAIERALRNRAAGALDHVVGCDYSAGMIELAQRRANGHADATTFRCDVEDGQALSYKDATFDAVFSCFGIFLFEDRHAGWREAARVLKPGGTFATTTWLAPEHNEMFRAQFGPIMESLPERLTKNLSPPGWLAIADADGLRQEVEQAGFTDVTTVTFHADLALPGADRAWRSLLHNPVGGALLRQCTPEELDVVEKHFKGSLQKRAAKAPLVLRASCNILVAQRS